MPPKKKGNSKNDTPKREETILVKSMEEVMHDSMMPYSEYVILERALPRVEDGLKPVQRRILFTMHELGITPDKPHRKCARIVGDCLGKYHPHGDTSVYDALARMAQTFVMRAPLVDGHGNFGSIDGDSPAAMRYTEARMTPLAEEMLRDIEKDTVGFHLNFDDTQKEPDLLPSRYPNLLVNGASGIAVGLATNIPPHNLGEVIDGTVAMLDKPNITTQELMQHIPAPDFPTGGILSCDDELLQAYETGRGKLQLRARVHMEDGSAGRKLIVITEMPYQVSKSALLEKILRLSEERKAQLAGIYDIRDESDRTGMRAVVEVKRDADADNILNLLYKYTDLQVTVGVNMVAIAGGKPVQMGLKQALSYYVEHQKNVVTRRTRYELAQAEARAHILEGLIIAVDNLDEVIRLIRSSKTPKEAKQRLMDRFALTEIQAQAILDMRLQRLTNLEIVALRREYEELEKLINRLRGILKSEKKLLNVIKTELLELREKYADARRTELTGGFEQIVIREEKPVADEVVVCLTAAGFLKRMAPKAFDKGMADAPEEMSEVVRAMTDEKLYFFTDLGNCYALPVPQVPECRWKERGIAPGGLLPGLEDAERVISVQRLAEDEQRRVVLLTRMGQVKRVEAGELNVRKAKYVAMSLKDGDRLVFAAPVDEQMSLLCITEKGMAIHFTAMEVPVQGRTAAGVKGMNVDGKAGDAICRVIPNDDEGEVIIATDKGYMKRCLLIDFELQARGGKGVKCINLLKNGSNGSRVVDVIAVKQPYAFDAVQTSGARTPLNTDDIKIELKGSKGTMYVLTVMGDELEKLVRTNG